MSNQAAEKIIEIAERNAKQARSLLDLLYADGSDRKKPVWLYRQSSISALMKLEAEYQCLSALLKQLQEGKDAGVDVNAALLCSQELLNGLIGVVLNFSSNEPQFKLDAVRLVNDAASEIAAGREMLGEQRLLFLGTERIVAEMGIL